MKNLLLTGATGFLGSHLAKAFLPIYKIYATKRPTSVFDNVKEIADRINWIDVSTSNLETVFNEVSPHTVIHCATQYGRQQISNLETIEANLILPLQILELCQTSHSSVFINTDTVLDKRISYYTFSKSHFREWMKFCSQRLVCVNIELEHFFGAGDNESKFVTWLIRSLIKNKNSLNFTPGLQTRSFIHVSDVVSAFLLIINAAENFDNGFYNFQVGSAQSMTIKDFVLLAKELTNNQVTSLNFGSIPYRENEVMNIEIDTTPLRQLGWAEKLTLREGLIMTIASERSKVNGQSK
jgi:CDP-paratose synthetase